MTEEIKSVPTEQEFPTVDWAIRAAEKIYLLYRDSNYFRSMPKQPLIAGWAKIILDNAPTPPFIISRPVSVPTEGRPLVMTLHNGVQLREGDKCRARGEDGRFRVCTVIELLRGCGVDKAILSAPIPFGTVIRSRYQIKPYMPKVRKQR